jgi:predicted nucleic acid-binding Zn ribbon protein
MKRTAIQRKAPIKRQARCVVCGVAIDAGFPSQPRRTCGPECRAIHTARTLEKHRTPERVARAVATRRAQSAAFNVDMPARPTTCARPGCGRGLPKKARAYCSPACHYADRGRILKRTQPYHRCGACGRVFAWDRTGPGAFCSDGCSREGPADAVVELVRSHGYRREDWYAQEMVACAGCGSADRLSRHHVVFDQHVVAARGDRCDPANQLIVCWACHASLHAKRDLSVALLPDSVFTFAAELLGNGKAYNYLVRRYAGEDARLDALLAKAAIA